MKNWERKNLGDVCEIVNGSTPLRTNKDFWENGNFPWFTIDDIREQGRIITDTKQKVTEAALSKLRVLPVDTVLLCCTASVGEYAITKIELTTNQQFNGLIVKDRKKLDPEFLMHYCSTLKDKLLGLSGKTTIDFIAISKLKLLEIPLPPLPEQQRIVSILDEAFAAIAKAKTNAEQNLKNARELFESYLQGVFEKKGDGWEEQIFENCFKLKSGDNLTAKNMAEGQYPVFGGNGIAGYHNEYNLSGGNVIIGRVGALCGNVRYINENIWLTDNAFKVVDFKFDFDHSFLTYLLNYKDLRSYARQAAQPVISNSSLKDVVLFFPKSKSEQQTIVSQLDALRAETQKLEAVYKKKIDDLEELKKSVLAKAFAGELKTEKALAL